MGTIKKLSSSFFFPVKRQEREANRLWRQEREARKKAEAKAEVEREAREKAEAEVKNIEDKLRELGIDPNQL